MQKMIMAILHFIGLVKRDIFDYQMPHTGYFLPIVNILIAFRHLLKLWNESEIGEQKPAFQQYFVSSILKQEIPQYFSPLHCWLFKLFAWIGSRKILGVKLTKRGLVNNQLLVLATYFLQFKFQKNLPLLEFSTQMIFLWLAAVWCRDWDVLVVHEFSFQPMPLGPFRASGRCRNSENREFCAHFASLSMSPNMPACPGHIGVNELFSKYWQEGSASSKGSQRVAICSNTLLLF